jgi:hypothetical protein
MVVGARSADIAYRHDARRDVGRMDALELVGVAVGLAAILVLRLWFQRTWARPSRNAVLREDSEAAEPRWGHLSEAELRREADRLRPGR